jgi:aspartate/methionine/tyrosine aminotransferase
MPLTELEAEVSAYAARHVIEHDLTSASTVAFPPPPSFLDDFNRAIRAGRSGYTEVRGSASVRELLAPRLSKMLGVEVDSERNLVLTAGTQAGLFATLAVLAQSGDSVLLADPEYLCDARAVAFFGAEPVYVPFARVGANAALDLDIIEQGLRDGARVVMFSNPHNPTGSVLAPDFLRRLSELLLDADAWVLADELYARFVYEEAQFTHFASIPGMWERTVTALGPSKTESGSGFRIGVLVCPERLAPMLSSVIELMTIRAPAYSQYALEHWLCGDEESVRSRVATYLTLRDVSVARLSKVKGLDVRVPAATGWLFPDISQLASSELETVESLIDAGVLVTPGASFGPSGAGCFRMSFGQDPTTWTEVVERIAEVLTSLASERPSE